MISLDHQRIVVSSKEAAEGATRAAALSCAGATVTMCSPETDLWSTLADETCDGIVVVVGTRPTSLQAYAPLRRDARTQALPCLVLLDEAEAMPFSDTRSRSAILRSFGSLRRCLVRPQGR